MDIVLSKKDAAERLGVSHRTVTRLIESGDLRAFKVRAQVRILPADLDKYIAARVKAGV